MWRLNAAPLVVECIAPLTTHAARTMVEIGSYTQMRSLETMYHTCGKRTLNSKLMALSKSIEHGFGQVERPQSLAIV